MIFVASFLGSVGILFAILTAAGVWSIKAQSDISEQPPDPKDD